MFHLNMYFQDANVLVLQPYQKNGKEVWKQYSYRKLFQRAFKKYQYFFSKEDIVKEFSKILNTDKFFFKGYYGVIDTKPRQFILNFSKKSSISYLKTQRLIEKSTSVIVSDRIDCIEAAQEESYDFYVSYKLNGKLIIEPVHHIVIREIKTCHNLARIISAHCLPYIIDKSYDFGRPYNFTGTMRESIGYNEAINRTKVLIDILDLYSPSFKRLGMEELYQELKSIMCSIPFSFPEIKYKGNDTFETIDYITNEATKITTYFNNILIVDNKTVDTILDMYKTDIESVRLLAAFLFTVYDIKYDKYTCEPIGSRDMLKLHGILNKILKLGSKKSSQFNLRAHLLKEGTYLDIRSEVECLKWLNGISRTLGHDVIFSCWIGKSFHQFGENSILEII